MRSEKMYQIPITWWNRKEQMPDKGKRILVFSSMYEENDPFRIRLIDSQFYEISIDAEWWAYVPVPQ